MVSSRQRNFSIVAKIRRSRAQVYGSNWSELSREIKKRDGNRCTMCGSTDSLQVHHIIPASKGGTSAPINLKTLCESCHARQPGHRHLGSW